MRETDTGLPSIDADLDGFPVGCVECGHPSIIAPTRGNVFRRLLRLRPTPAACVVREYDMSGLAALPCGCAHPSHGS